MPVGLMPVASWPRRRAVQDLARVCDKSVCLRLLRQDGAFSHWLGAQRVLCWAKAFHARLVSGPLGGALSQLPPEVVECVVKLVPDYETRARDAACVPLHSSLRRGFSP